MGAIVAGASIVTSNGYVVTVAAAAPYITIPTSLSLSSIGGTVSVPGTTNLPDGTVFTLFLNGVTTGQTVTSSGGAFSFSYVVPANTALSPVTDTFTVEAPGP